MMGRWFAFKKIVCPRTAPGTARRRPRMQSTALDRFVDGAVLAPMFLTPWFLGGCHPLGQWLLAVYRAGRGCGSGGPTLAAQRDSEWTLTPIHGLLLAAIGVALLQLTPLPGWLLVAFAVA